MSVVFLESIWAEILIFLIFDTSFCWEKETLLQVCWMYMAMPNYQIGGGLAWSVLLSTMIFIITEVKTCYRLTWPSQVNKKKTFEHCDNKHYCLETTLNPCQFLFYHNNDVKQNDSFSDKGIAWQVDASSVTCALINQRQIGQSDCNITADCGKEMFGKYSWHPVIKNSQVSVACIYEWTLRKNLSFNSWKLVVAGNMVK